MTANAHSVSEHHAPDTTRSNALQLGLGQLTLDVRARTAHIAGKPLHLTPSEFALVEALVERPGFVVTRAQLRRRLPGTSDDSADHTMDVYLRNIRRKLEPAGIALAYVETVFGAGYRAVSHGDSSVSGT